MILGTSKISLNLGPIIGHFWARRPRICGLSYTKIPQEILESIWEHLGKYYFDFLELQKILNSGPTKHLFVLKVFWRPAPPNRLVYIIVFEGH